MNPNVNFLVLSTMYLYFIMFTMLVSVTSIADKKGKGKDNTRTKKSSNCPYPTEKELG